MLEYWNFGPGEIEKSFTPVRSAGPSRHFHGDLRGGLGKNDGYKGILSIKKIILSVFIYHHSIWPGSAIADFR
jgi:hypothetical protein